MLNIDDRLIKEVSPQIGPNALSVLLAIAIHLNKRTGRAFPSHARLMELTGMSKNTVYDALKRLKQFGLLVSEQKIDSEKGHFGKRTFRLTTRFISIFIAAEDAEPLIEQDQDIDRFPKNRLPVSRLPENRLPENWETQQLNKEELLNNKNDLKKGTCERAHENEPESFDLEAEKSTPSPIAPAPSPAAGRRANTSDEAENLIRAWANGDGKETVRNWIAETTFSEKVHGRVRDEITKFVGHYAVSEKPGVSYKMFADPVLFFQNRFKAWLVQAKELNRPANKQQAAATATYEPPRRILN